MTATPRSVQIALMTPSTATTREQDRRRDPLGPPVRMMDRVQIGVPDRETGRSDLPVIGPDDSPRRIARRLV
jgi:hypothetical protein